MKGGAHMSVEESEMIMQLLGVQYSQEFNSDFCSYFSSYYKSNNWHNKNICNGLNNKMVDQEGKPTIKRKFDSCTNIPRKKAHACIKISASKENEEEMLSSILSKNDLFDKSKGMKGNPSLYARKRREKINLRLRKLQELIPSGTKVDISTMLAEAFQYIKFLQHQIEVSLS